MRALTLLLLIASTWPAPPSAPCATVPADGVIRAAGRYCVAGERRASGTVGIDIAAGNVVVDLNGGTLRAAKADPKSIGVLVRDASSDVTITGGVIQGFAIGISNPAANGLRIDKVTLRDTGAIAIKAGGDRSAIVGTTIESVGGTPLDPANAYAIGANLTGRNVSFSKNTIRNVTRQAVPATLVGEAVGVLVGDGCAECVVDNNVIAKSTPEAKSIGIWNSGIGQVEIRNNSIVGFDQGVIALGRKFIVHDNQLTCAGGPSTTGVLISLGRGGADQGEGAAFGNRFTSCAIEQLICDNGCKAPWVLELLQRRQQMQKRPPVQ